MEGLLEWVDEYNLTITRNGADYLGLKGSGNKRFRIRFVFNNHTRTDSIKKPTNAASRLDGCWIYALTAYSKDYRRKACYIGRTTRLSKRFYEHLHSRRYRRGSYFLFRWASKHGVNVNAIVLAWSESGLDQWTKWANLEGYWLGLATESRIATPGVENWGRLPQDYIFTDQPKVWPEEKILKYSKPLVNIVDEGETPYMMN